ncbi:MAG: energy-coupling factor ABC transporter permease [Candidatus Thiodiazotropha lotti]|uniref:Molecular chaperone DnaJ n=1 Tax=Candidatus Thiodiazotropha endoloripes TaxID=1818881 RepID=A0A1E2UMA1_9GAMM|nr:energy-coupling factor ABC transporter permease [Candidatus Thiodiazotropha endoloripes]MCG7897044.1 energy-coupling factor ABC transporter permease [Candidatus Thiodiazotropha weberae]MCG7991704.1 energy-coupling factor ABC transporter permease [Candidatus Thiodiazotropha lotti]MCG7904490.1 energy-coupling factor ABC transporter permease [Candidatus Thiodiazotropha weberae]MCG7913167.1 energy-coupling factor ABC transporter permease [Candidatus Thiodiazotropha weberae]MCG7999728.1 energy-c
MELDGGLFSTPLLFWLAGLCGAVLIAALKLATWQRLTQQNLIHVFLGAIVCLIALWHMRGQIQPGLSFHLLGVTVITLMFGWSLAILAASIALFAVSMNAGYGWEGYVVSFLTVVLVPITLSQIALVLVRSWLPRQFFIYVLGNGFFTAWLVGYISGYLAMQLLVLSGAYTMAELQVTIIPFFPLMFFPEALINGWVITMLVVFFPAWVYSFSDEQYLHGK